MARREAVVDGECETRDVLGFAVSSLDREALLARISGFLADPWDGRCRHVVTLNPEYIIEARHNVTFADGLHASDLTTADGIGIVLAARVLYGRDRNVKRVTGVEITEHLAQLSGQLVAGMFLLGARPGIADAAAGVFTERFSDCRVAGVWAGGSAAPKDDLATIEKIRASAARVVLVAYGAPGQITWIQRNRTYLAGIGVRLVIGVGGTFDYISGQKARAPALLRRVGLEWLYRLVREPWRWRRQLALPKFAFLVVREKRVAARKPPS